MMHRDEIARGAFFALVDYCETSKCGECIFRKEGIGCIFIHGSYPEVLVLPDNQLD